MIQFILTTYPEWQVKPKDKFAISIELSRKNRCINLDNLYHQVQLHREPKQVLIQHFLSEFARVIGNTENSSGDFDAIKNKISLVVRPTDLYSECLTSDYDKQLAFSLPILPDLALYWIVDNINNWQYITNAQFSKWKMHAGKVMWWAYENTCKAEECMNTGEIHEGEGEVGLLISTNRKFGTISHLLYEPRNLQRLIHSTRPDWPEQLYWVCIPVPNLIIVVKEGHDEIIKKISPIAQERYGKILSNRIYIFSKNNFTGEVIHQPGQKEPIIMDLEGRIPGVVLPD